MAKVVKIQTRKANLDTVSVKHASHDVEHAWRC